MFNSHAQIADSHAQITDSHTQLCNSVPVTLIYNFFFGQGKGADGALGREEYRQKLWMFIVKKEIPKMAKQFSTSRHNTLMNNKKVCVRWQLSVRE